MVALDNERVLKVRALDRNRADDVAKVVLADGVRAIDEPRARRAATRVFVREPVTIGFLVPAGQVGVVGTHLGRRTNPVGG